MKKNLFIGALAVFALTACSQDEVVDTNQYGNEIGFTAVANKGSRAKDSFCNATLPTDIHVWAYAGSNKYFDNETYGRPTDQSSASYTAEGSQRFWPESDALNFFAVAGTTDATYNTVGITSGTEASIANYTIKNASDGDAAEQEDLLYAVELGCKKPSTGGVQKLNFRHALSKIVFRAKNGSNNLHVVIDGISVCNVCNQGTFTFDKNTTTNWSTHEDGTHAEDTDYTPENNNESGSWGTTPNGNASYDLSFSSVTVGKGNTGVDLTNEKIDNELLLMPQTKAVAVLSKDNLSSATYLKVKCIIYNIADTDNYNAESFLSDDNKGKQVVIFGKKNGESWESDYIYIPIGFTWNPGDKYVYTINFGNGDGGLDEDLNPVLVPISYSVTVDDFDQVSNTDADAVPDKK